MKKFFSLIVIGTVFATTLSFSKTVNAEILVGEITMIGNGVIKIKEDATGVEYQLIAPPNKLISINEPHNRVTIGQRVEANVSSERVLSLEILGMPMKAKSEPFQKWKVIKYPEGQSTSSEKQPDSGEQPATNR
jgi:hypothetical protein